jgi:hypothetical protein
LLTAAASSKGRDHSTVRRNQRREKLSQSRKGLELSSEEPVHGCISHPLRIFEQAERCSSHFTSHDLCSSEGMRERIIKSSAAMLLLSLALTGCSLMTKSGRQQLAYRNYVRKHTRERDRRLAQARAKSDRNFKAAVKSTAPSAPKMRTDVEPAADQAIISTAIPGEGENNSQLEP